MSHGRRKRQGPEQIIRELREADGMLAAGRPPKRRCPPSTAQGHGRQQAAYLASIGPAPLLFNASIARARDRFTWKTSSGWGRNLVL